MVARFRNVSQSIPCNIGQQCQLDGLLLFNFKLNKSQRFDVSEGQCLCKKYGIRESNASIQVIKHRYKPHK